MVLAFSAGSAAAHPGGTNADGCHTNRKTGEYHCHSPKRNAPPPRPRQSPGTDNYATYYANCSQARRAGVAPLRQGDPGYRAGLDRDGDGIACE